MKSDLAQWAAAPASWITGEGETLGETVISSRIRMARNLFTVPFPQNATAQLQKQAREQILAIFHSSKNLPAHTVFHINDFDQLERAFLMERQLISREHANTEGEKWLLVTTGESISIMVNEEDHIRAASFQPGLNLKDAWEKLDVLDDELSAKCSVAYDADFGYVTACPTNTGTGLRASCLLHLPGLTLTGKVNEVITKLERMGVTTRGFYGEGTRALGDLYQISNALTLGRSESFVLDGIGKVVRSVSSLEKIEEKALFDGPGKIQVEDRIFRSLGILQSARALEFEEGMHHLSLVRLGKKANLDIPLGMKKLTNLFFLAQPAHLWLRKGEAAAQSTTEAVLRADYMRGQF